MRVTCGVVGALLLAAVASAEPPRVPKVVAGKVGAFARLEVPVPKGKKLVVAPAFEEGEGTAFEEFIPKKAGNRRFALQADAPGAYPVVMWYAGEEDDKVLVAWTIRGAAPVPPGPTPTPTPPAPPTPDPAPIPAPGLHVLVVYEKADAAKLTRDQLNTIYGADFAAYLDSKCPVGPDGVKRTWRIWDKDVNPAGDEDPVWAAAMRRPRASHPWIVVSNPGRGGEERALPATRDEIMALVRKYGG